MNQPVFRIDLDKKCVECGKPGTADNTLCLGCTTKAVQGKPMRSAAGRLVAMRFADLKKARR